MSQLIIQIIVSIIPDVGNTFFKVDCGQALSAVVFQPTLTRIEIAIVFIRPIWHHTGMPFKIVDCLHCGYICKAFTCINVHRYSDLFQTGAILKCQFSDVCQQTRQYKRFNPRASTEGSSSYPCDRIGNGQCCDAGTVLEGPRADTGCCSFRYQRQRSQRCAIPKCTLTNRFKRRRQYYLCQACTIPEASARNFHHAFWQGYSFKSCFGETCPTHCREPFGQFNCFQKLLLLECPIANAL